MGGGLAAGFRVGTVMGLLLRGGEFGEVRGELAAAVGGPEVRRPLVSVVPIRTKLFMTVAGAALVPVAFALMLIGNAMNQPRSTMTRAYDGDVEDGAAYDLPGEVVLGKGASEQKANLAAMLHAIETVIAARLPVNGRLVFVCCVSGETGRHDANHIGDIAGL